ncbi:MAG: redoxin domain-containing protein, partial [Methanolinea sp.]|nr:redoxin domain-containing protein [Methanolinea sp.]
MQRQDPAILSIVMAAAVLVAATVIVSGCTTPVQQGPSPATGEDWRSIPFQDVRTGETLTIGGFSGRPVILYAFTVSCPICTRQQKEITALKTTLGDQVEIVGLDIDPGENAETLKDHIAQNRFSG